MSVYLSFIHSRLATSLSSLTRWRNDNQALEGLFGLQAIPMIWHYGEANPFSSSSKNWFSMVGVVVKAVEQLAVGTIAGHASQEDATNSLDTGNRVLSFDPPYYDNIGYADLSDFYYVWLRRTTVGEFTDLFATLATPKKSELVATTDRHKTINSARSFFQDGMRRVLHSAGRRTHTAMPITVYYAFKQAEVDTGTGTASTGWETFLSGANDAGLHIYSTWPIRTELPTRQGALGANSLASSVILSCRPRPLDAPVATRGEFRRRLQAEFPEALRLLQTSNIAPVDLAQASIGPGMRIFTEYARVEKSDGTPMSVREALAMINETLDEVQVQQEGDFDADTRWAATWLDQHGFDLGDYGEAETLSKARNTSVAGLVEAGVVESRRGQVALILPEDLDPNWIPQTDSRKTVWEMTHHLIRVLETRGEREAGELMRQFQFFAESARDLAYRLYSISERHNRASDARRYNALIQSWPEIARLSREDVGTQQALLDGD